MGLREGGPNARARSAWLLAAVFVGVGSVYAPALRGPFLWDDHLLIVDHPAVAELQPLPHYLTRAFWSDPRTPADLSYYRPLTTWSYALEWRAWQGQPTGFHVTNLLGHLLCCGLLFGLARKAGATPWVAALAAALFGLAPRLSESVAWIGGRTDVFAAAGALAALWLHDSDEGRGGRRVAAALALVMGLLFKEVAIAGAAAIAALEAQRWWRGDANGRGFARNLAPLTAGVALYGALRIWAFSAGAPTVASAATLPLADRPLFALQALGRYAGMLLDPLRPRLSIGTTGIVEPLWIAFGVGAALAIGLGAQRLLRRTTPPARVAAAVLAIVGLAPVLHLLGIPLPRVAADRFLYLPLAGLALVAASAVGTLGPRASRAALAAALVAIPLFASATGLRAADWADELRLWTRAMQRAPALDPITPEGLGHALFAREQYAEALEAFREAARRKQALAEQAPAVAPELETTLSNVALSLVELDRVEEALPLLREIAGRVPDAATSHFNLGLAEARQLELAASEASLERALAIHPGYSEARQLLENVRIARSEWEALPPPDAEEPTRIRAARAVVWVRVGQRQQAARRFAVVLAAADAAPSDVRRAALFLVLYGEPEQAWEAVARLRATPGLSAEAERLAEALDARLAERETGRS
jgi:tetratricopeptide (TPR) repeat protein